MNKKILFITVAFPPRLSPASLRISSFSKELKLQGFEIFVVTCNHKDDNKFEFKNNLDESKIVRIDYFDIFNLSRHLPFKLIRQFYTKLISFFISPTGIFFPDLRFFFWRNKALSICSDLISKENIECVYTSFSPISTMILGYKIKKKHPNIIWIAEYRDLWSLNHNVGKIKKRFAKLELKIEKKIVKNANHVITVSKGLADLLSNSLKRPVEVIYTGTSESRFNQSPIYEFQYPTILYCGSIYRKNYDINPFLEGVKLFLEKSNYSVKISILFIGQKIPNSWIKKAKQLEISSYISYEPKQDFDTVISKQLGATILLLPLWNQNQQGIVTSKLFEYLSAKKPILAVGNQIESAELIEKYGIGIMTINPKEISNFIKDKVNNSTTYKKDLYEIEKKTQINKLVKLLLRSTK